LRRRRSRSLAARRRRWWPAWPLGAAHACTLTEELLSHSDVHHLRKELNDRKVRSLELLGPWEIR